MLSAATCISRCCDPYSIYLRSQASGDHRERVTPVPIPNTAVKPLIADDTARATVWESRTSPDKFFERPLGKPEGFSLFGGPAQRRAYSRIAPPAASDAASVVAPMPASNSIDGRAVSQRAVPATSNAAHPGRA